MNTVRALYEFFMSAKGPFALLEIFVIFLGFYYFIRFCEGTRGAGILKGLALIITVGTVGLNFGASALDLKRLENMLGWLATASTTALVILLQPELRRGLARLSQSKLFKDILREGQDVVDELLKASYRMAKNNVGALIAIEREDNLQSYIDRGTSIDGELSAELISSIFYPGTELHDGAVILRRGRIAAAGSLFPLSEDQELGTWAGTRHRAAVGLTEESDAVVIVVSEERGKVSLCVRGKIQVDLDREELERELRDYLGHKEEWTNEESTEPVPEEA